VVADSQAPTRGSNGSIRHSLSWSTAQPSFLAERRAGCPGEGASEEEIAADEAGWNAIILAEGEIIFCARSPRLVCSLCLWMVH
jgi:hypothetical protein